MDDHRCIYSHTPGWGGGFELKITVEEKKVFMFHSNLSQNIH